MAGTYTQQKKNIQVSSPVSSATKQYSATSGKRIADNVIGAIVEGQQKAAMANAYRNKLLEQQAKQDEILRRRAELQQGTNKTAQTLGMTKDIINALAKSGIIKTAFDKATGQEPATQAPAPAQTPEPTASVQAQPETPSAATPETDIGDKGAFGGTEIGATETTGIGAEATSESPTDPSISDAVDKYQLANDNLRDAGVKLEAAAKRASSSESAYERYERARYEYDKANKIREAHGKIVADIGGSVMGKGPLAFSQEGELVPALTLTDAGGNIIMNPNARLFDTVSVKGDPTLMGENTGAVGADTELKTGQEQGGNFSPITAAISGINLASGVSDIIEKGPTIGNVPGTISSGLNVVNQGARAAMTYGTQGMQEAGKAITGAISPALSYVPYVGAAIAAAPSAYGAVKSAFEGGLDPSNKQQFARMHNQINDVADKIVMVVQPWYAAGRGAATLVNKALPDDQTLNTILGIFDPAGMLSGEYTKSLQNKTFGTWICTAVKKHTYLTEAEEIVIEKLRAYAKKEHKKWFRIYLVHGMKLINAISKQEKDLKEFYTYIREILVKPVTELFDKDNEAAYQLYHRTTELLKCKYLPEFVVEGGE